LLGVRIVRLATNPVGAKVVFVPLDENLGEPLPDKAIRPRRRTPLTQELPAGDYLVVAVLDDGRFHEVYRRVPRDTETLAGVHSHLRWEVKSDRSVRMPGIAIPEEGVTSGMAIITGASPDESFYMDCHELTVADYRHLSGGKLPSDKRWRAVPDDYAVTVAFDTAVALAEVAGKRLPTESEFDYASQRRVQQSMSPIPEESDLSRNLGPAGVPSEDHTDTTPAIVGLCSNVAEWTVSRVAKRSPSRNVEMVPLALTPHERLVTGGDSSVTMGDPLWVTRHHDPELRVFVPENSVRPGLGFRCVRSSAPRFLDE